MKEHDIIRFIGRFPDKIMTIEEAIKNPFTSKVWKCSRCGEVYRYEIEVGIPAPCRECSDIFFEKLEEGC